MFTICSVAILMLIFAFVVIRGVYRWYKHVRRESPYTNAMVTEEQYRKILEDILKEQKYEG